MVKEGFRNGPKLQAIEKNRLQELFAKSVKDKSLLAAQTPENVLECTCKC